MSSLPIGADRELIRPGIPRPVEAVLAGLGILLCSAVLGAVALAVWVTSPGPVLFRQRRVGRGGDEFTLLKFRTMKVNQDALQVTSKGDLRITPIGRWLRLLKLDELPTLWNVVKGEMSLVGPRPEVPRYVNLANPLWRDVLRARPGITDPVTLYLRNEEDLMATASGDGEQFYLETLQPFKLVGYLGYLRRRSFSSDVRVIVRTLVAIVAPATAPVPLIAEVLAAWRGAEVTARLADIQDHERDN